MYNKTIHEIISTHVWFMDEPSFDSYRKVLTANFAAHTLAEELGIEKSDHRLRLFDAKGKTIKDLYLERVNDEVCEYELEVDEGIVHVDTPEQDPDSGEVVIVDKKVLLLECRGPVTRNGDGCSYGSRDYRDLMLHYAKDKNVAGMVFITDTPGGSAMALDDFQQGIDAWHAAGKRSIQLIDGMSASAGVAQGVQCQKIIAVNPYHEVGCIGAMMAGYTQKDGDTNTITGERFMYIVASQTPDKNLEFRQAAEGNYKMLQEEVDRCGQHFLDTIQRCRPQIPHDMRTGKMYPAKDCIGTLIDGIGNLDSAMHYVLTGEETWNADASVYGVAEATDTEETNTQTLNISTMKRYESIEKAVGLQEGQVLAVDATEGFYMNAPLAQALTETLAANEQVALTAKANAEALEVANGTIAKLNKEIDEQKKTIATLTAEKDETEKMSADKTETIDSLEQANKELADEKAALTEKLNKAAEDLKTAEADHQNKLAELEQQLKQKEDEIKALSENVPAAPQPGAPSAEEESSEDNGTAKTIYKPGMSCSEKAAAREARMRELVKRRC